MNFVQEQLKKESKNKLFHEDQKRLSLEKTLVAFLSNVNNFNYALQEHKYYF